MAIRVDTNGDGIWDLELNDPSVTLNSIVDVSNDADNILDVVITSTGSSAVIDGVIFRAVTATNAGTGIYNTFLAIGDNDGNEAGFNSDDTPPIDATNVDIDQAKTETVLLSDIPITLINGVEYYEVRIDINDANNVPNALISLDDFRIYTSSDGTILSTTQLFTQNKVFDIDDNGGGNISILLSDAQSSGSGNDDYSILIPVSRFGTADPATTYFYLYARMGFAGGDYVAGSTFEEFNLQNAVTLSGTKFNDRDGDGVRDAGEEGLGGVTIFIDTDQDGVFDAGLERSTVTAADGSYTFYGVASGTYRIDEMVPTGSTQTTGAFETITITDNQAGTHGIFVIDPIGNFNPIDISGRKYLDDEGDGSTSGDAGLGNVTIFIDMDGSGTFNAGDLSTTTAGDGTWSFTNLGSNTIGKTVNEVLPNGYVQTLGVAADGYVITGDMTGLDFANVRLGSISGTKTEDLDGVVGGTQGAWTYGAVTIELVQNNVVIATTTTDASGNYSFANLLPGSYIVREVTPTGSVVVGSATVDASGQTSTSGFAADVDFANVRYGSISGTKTEDLDGVVGGTQGAWTYGAVTIELVQNNVVIATTTTDASGNYSFANLLPGSYIVREVTPTGSVVVGSATVDASGQTSTSGFAADVDFANVRYGSISGTKTEDLDGVVGGTQGAWTYGAVTIELVQNNVVIATTTTDASGNYSFANLLPGSYIVREVTPTGSVVVGSATVDASGQTSTSGFAADVDFANVRYGSISGTKTEDLDGVVGGTQGAWTYGAVTIELVQNNVVIATTTTDASGNYSFANLLPGSYIVREVTPTGSVVVGSATVDASGQTSTSGFAADVDFANVRYGSISGTKTEDLDGVVGGTQGAWTYGAVTIELVQNNVVIATTTTDASGNYSFANLLPGSYIVREVTPTGSVVVGSATVDASGQTSTSGFAADVDFANVRYGSISGTKTEDLDGVVGGTQGAWTYGAVTIELVQNNVVIATTTTDASGNYSFANLLPGSYIVREVTPTGSVVVGSATVDASGQTSTSGFAADVDFANVRYGSISGTKTEDLDGVVGGTQGAWTYGAVTIELVQNNVVIATTTTDASGNYSFANLLPGSYIVREVTPTGSVVVGSATVDASGQTSTSGFAADVDFANVRYGSISGTKTEDLDGVVGGTQGAWTYGAVTIELVQNNVVIATTTTDASGNYSFANLLPGSYIVREVTPTGSVVVGSATVDASGQTSTSGFAADVDFANVRYGSISGTKTEDLDGVVGGTQGAWTYGAVTIELVQNNVVIATTTTDASGNYSFANLLPGSYIVREVTPTGSVVVGSATVDASGQTSTSGFAADVDFANVRYGSISGTKTEDLDGVVGGTQGAWTYGAVTIELVQNNVVIATTTTDASGNYSFANLLPGSYIVREVTPTGSVVVGSATVDASGQTSTSGFAADVDFANVRYGSISGTKTEDLDGVVGGTQGAWTYGAVTIELVQNNVVIATTTTDASGNYSFANLLPGSYIVREVTPTGSVVVGSATVDASGQTSTSGFAADVDFANVRYGSISGTKTEDLDGVVGGTQGAWTYGAVTIELVQNNVVIATTQTDASGNYSFANLLPGSYIVREVTPTGSVVVGSATVDASGQTSTSGFAADVDFANVRYGSISGTKTEDLDGVVGGTQGAWTYGAVTIELVQNNVVIATTTTDASGNYSFANLLPGSYIVREVTPTGSVVVGSATVDASGQTSTSGFAADVDFANVRLGSISGTKTEDLDGVVGGTQGAWTYGAVTIELVQNNVVIATTQTDASGNYSFANLLPGSYIVREVTPTGSVVVGSATVDASGQTSTSGFAADVDFANVRYGSISGTKTEDLDGVVGGTQGAWTYGAVTIELVQNNVVIATTQTDASGNYSFANLLPGSYIVREVTPTGSVVVGSATVDASGQTSTSGFAADVDFANVRLGRISGTKYEDADGLNGTIDDRAGLGGVTIELWLNGALIDTAVTADDGSYAFEGLLPGDYEVRETLPDGSFAVTPITVTLNDQISGFDAIANFVNTAYGRISGTKYEDADGSNTTTEDRTGLGGVTIELWLNGELIDTAVTAGDGSYAFEDLIPGDYEVREILPGGYVAVTPVTVTLEDQTSGFDAVANFVNFDPDPVIVLEKYVSTDVSGGELDADDPDGPIASTSTTVNFHVSLANTGNVALTNITLSDSVVHTINGIAGAPVEIDYNDPAYGAWVDLDGDTVLDLGEDWITADGDGDGVLEGVILEVGDTLNIYYSLTSELGQHENTASVTATAVLGGEGVGDSDDANYYVLPSEDCVGVGTPGFWGRNGATFWDGIQNNERHTGDPNVDGDSDPGFADGELLYAVDSNNDGVAGGAGDQLGLLVGDFNHNGLNDEGNAIFISLATATTLINASQKQTQDGKYMLGRDVVATWLNFLANGGNEGDTSCIDRPGTSDDGFNPQHYLSDAINWLQTFAGAEGIGAPSNLGDNARNESFDVFSLLTTAVKTNSIYWQTAITSANPNMVIADHSASNMHSSLDAYNNTGVINGTEFCCDRDNADAMFALAQLSQNL